MISEKHINGINNNEVWYYEVVGGGHDWPGAWGNMDINAGEEAWLFFQKYIDDILSTPDSLTLEDSIRLFPNPSNGLIRIESNNNIALQEVLLYDSLGTNLDVRFKNDSIDIEYLGTGIYILVLKTSDGIITRKIVKN